MNEATLLRGGGYLKIHGEHEQKVIDQMMRCLDAQEGTIGVLAADGHFGYSAPVGANIAYREHLSPACVGYDIGCGNMAVATNVHANGDFKKALPGLMDRIFKEINFGVGRGDGDADHPVLDKIARAENRFQRDMAGQARKQLGTVGGGNHYVDLFKDETGRIWIGVHFGSRGFGHKTATEFLKLAALENGRTYTEGKGEMEAPPDLIRADSSVGWMYREAMTLAGEYAFAGREVVVEQVRQILGAEYFGEAVHNHHNFAWREEHLGAGEFWVVRKGATPAFPGQKGFVGASMGEDAVILEGVESDDSQTSLYSTVHGAGRQMSRTQAAGKSRKRWTCQNRDCEYVQAPRTSAPMVGNDHDTLECPLCGGKKLQKRWVKETDGAIDWSQTIADLRERGIELRGANAEEAPGAYKRLSEVLSHHEGTVKVLHTLTPLGVAMAPGNIHDPYKD